MPESKPAARIWVPAGFGLDCGAPGTPRLWIALSGLGKSVKGSSLLIEKTLRKQGAITMPQENDLEGVQDQGGKHGGQKGMPKPEPRPTTRREPGRGHAPDQGIVRDERGQEQPRDKERAQQVSRTDPTRR